MKFIRTLTLTTTILAMLAVTSICGCATSKGEHGISAIVHVTINQTEKEKSAESQRKALAVVEWITGDESADDADDADSGGQPGDVVSDRDGAVLLPGTERGNAAVLPDG